MMKHLSTIGKVAWGAGLVFLALWLAESLGCLGLFVVYFAVSLTALVVTARLLGKAEPKP